MSADKTPETKIPAELALKAYQCIIDRGAKADAYCELQGVRAWLDVDGYGVTLTDGSVTLRVLFHNRIALDTPNSRSLMRFRKRLEAISQSGSSTKPR